MLGKSLILILFVLFTSKNLAQNTFHFVNDEKLDTISYYSLHIYSKNKEKKLLPNENNGIELTKKIIRKADSIVIHFDSWYKENIPKKAFHNSLIFIRKQLYIGEVELNSNKIQTLGTINNLYKKGHYYGYEIGSLNSFPIDTLIKIKKFSIYIRNTKYKNSELIPEIFVADSLNDPNKIYLYPHQKIMKINRKIKHEWFDIPIKTFVNKNKSKIFMGFVSHTNFTIAFGRVYLENNIFLNNFSGRLGLYGNEIWYGKQRFSIMKRFGIPAVKIEYEYLE
ncbi:hypothetical protein [Aureivirga marina]|uniref:hypothetical protein n=1 Tax=Aureivirga marina TaxID=1182451 RepID=UPI0018CA84E6|nr:hypothetical protein [Aureivirga marina]